MVCNVGIILLEHYISENVNRLEDILLTSQLSFYLRIAQHVLGTADNINTLECGPMPNVMAALSNIGGALCSTSQSLADARCWSAVQ